MKAIDPLKDERALVVFVKALLCTRHYWSIVTELEKPINLVQETKESGILLVT